jgi:hypothetical protein
LAIEVNATDFFGNATRVNVDAVIDFCPICRSSVEPKFLTAVLNGEGGDSPILQLVYRCPRKFCGRAFLSFYEGIPQSGSGRRWYFLHHAAPVTPAAPRIPELVAALSERFQRVYTQAAAADELKLDEVAGPGYRKALEILVKDFALTMPGVDPATVKRTLLGPCIETYIPDERVKRVAKRAAWLGNDETHYERRWENQDIEDLKRLLAMTINAIDNELLARKYESEMKEKDKKK